MNRYASNLLTGLHASGGHSVKHDHSVPTTGYVVSAGYEMRLKGVTDLSLEDLISTYCETYEYLIRDNNSRCFGIWRAEDGSVCVDVSDVYSQFGSAYWQAHSLKEDAIYHIDSGTTLYRHNGYEA